MSVAWRLDCNLGYLSMDDAIRCVWTWHTCDPAEGDPIATSTASQPFVVGIVGSPGEVNNGVVRLDGNEIRLQRILVEAEV